MVRAIYPGSFDPITLGHLDLIHRAAKLFDNVIVAVVGNPQKSALLPFETRAKLIEQVVSDIKGVSVSYFQGLTVDFAKQNNINILIRGLRAVSDYEAELAMAQTNRQLFPELETIFLMTKPEYSFISSTTVKEVVRLGGDVSHFVPESVNSYIRQYFSRGAE